MSAIDLGRSLRTLATEGSPQRSEILPMWPARLLLVAMLAMEIGLVAYHGNILSRAKKADIGALLPDKFTNGAAADIITPKYTQNETVVEGMKGAEELIRRFEAAESTQDFTFEDAESLLAPYRGKLACAPDSFGYSMAESQVIFPPKDYPRCNDTYKQLYSYFKANVDEHWVELQCKDQTHREYVAGPSGSFTFPEFIEAAPLFKTKIMQGNRSELGAHEDFILARCGNNTKFDIAYHHPIYNKRRHQEALAAVPAGTKPIIVFLLVVDSFSRRHFFQKLPLTVQLLNTLQTSPEYTVFDHKLHNVMGDGSVHNTMPIFMPGDNPPNLSHRYTNKLRNEPIWGDFKRNGYMTLVLFESCDQMFPDELGRVVSADHLVRQFYCGLMQFSGYSSKKENVGEQRCVGHQMSHMYGFEYVNAFSDMYKGAKQFIYAHFTTAHEASGQHAVTLDQDLRDFLQTYLTRFSADYEIAIMLQGDHGMRFGDWYNNMKAYQEHKLPAYFFIATRSLLKLVPNAYSIQHINTLRVHSKKDVRRTLMALMRYPDFTPFPQEDPSGLYYSVFSEAIPGNRTCSEANIPAWYCSCLSYQAIDLNWDKDLAEVVRVMADLTIFAMNSMVFANEKTISGHLCQKIEVNKVEEAYGVKATDFSEIVKIVFSVKNTQEGRFTATFLLSPRPIGHGLRRHQSNRQYLDPTPYHYRGYRTYLSVITISRIDPFEGNCASAARKLALKPDFCFCGDID